MVNLKKALSFKKNCETFAVIWPVEKNREIGVGLT
jgi:hypothetical protein